MIKLKPPCFAFSNNREIQKLHYVILILVDGGARFQYFVADPTASHQVVQNFHRMCSLFLLESPLQIFIKLLVIHTSVNTQI